MPSFPIFLQKLRKEAVAPFFFLFSSSPPVLVRHGCRRDSSCSSVTICSSCGGRRCHSGSHESLLCGQSDHADRDPAATGRGSDSTTLQANRVEIRYRNSGCVKLCVHLFVFACKRNCLCFVKSMHLQPDNWRSTVECKLCDRFTIQVLSSLRFHNLGCVVTAIYWLAGSAKNTVSMSVKASCSTFNLSL